MPRKVRIHVVPLDMKELDPEDIEMMQERAASFDPDTAVSLADLIAEWEKDPAMKRSLDKARREMKGAEIIFAPPRKP